jgi:hypothetical protein
MLFRPKAKAARMGASEKFWKNFGAEGYSVHCLGKNGHSIYSKFISLIFEEPQKTSMRTNEKILAPLSLIFLSSGCIPAYFHSMLCAMSLWMIGFAIMNIHVFVLTRKKF